MEARLGRDFGDIPLEELQQLKAQIGAKKYKETVEKKMMEASTVYQPDNETNREEKKASRKKSFKRANKNRPREMSSKAPVRKMREVTLPKSKKERRDPRFDDQSGHLNMDLFKKSYAFIDEQKVEERKLIKKFIGKTKNVAKKEELSSLLHTMERREKEEKEREEKQKVERELKKERHERTRKGGQPFYLKKSDQKKVALAKKYQELKSKGSVSNYLAKRRKKNAAKEHRYLPYSRHKETKTD
eukprot:m.311429 g.311429  ORF g.311429 m.311429 type:complete len:244 (+) comp69515_c0_seq1:33-764(+)